MGHVRVVFWSLYLWLACRNNMVYPLFEAKKMFMIEHLVAFSFAAGMAQQQDIPITKRNRGVYDGTPMTSFIYCINLIQFYHILIVTRL